MDNVTFTPPAIANLKDMLNKSAMLYGEKDAYQIKKVTVLLHITPIKMY